MNKALRKVSRFWAGVYRQFFNDQCPMHAASLSFTTLLSLVPLMAVGLGVLAAFPVFSSYADKMQDWVFNHFVAASADVIRDHLLSFVKNTTKLSATGFLFLVVAAVLMIFSMETAFNMIWRVRERRHGFAAFWQYGRPFEIFSGWNQQLVVAGRSRWQTGDCVHLNGKYARRPGNNLNQHDVASSSPRHVDGRYTVHGGRVNPHKKWRHTLWRESFCRPRKQFTPERR